MTAHGLQVLKSCAVIDRAYSRPATEGAECDIKKNREAFS